MKPTSLKRHPELLSVGRKDLPATEADGEDDGRSEVSRKHIDLIIYADGSIELIDRASSNGTFTRDGEEWQQVESPVQVTEATAVRLGGLYETDVARLISTARGRAGNRLPDATNVVQKKSRPGAGASRWARNPETGKPEQH